MGSSSSSSLAAGFGSANCFQSAETNKVGGGSRARRGLSLDVNQWRSGRAACETHSGSLRRCSRGEATGEATGSPLSCVARVKMEGRGDARPRVI